MLILTRRIGENLIIGDDVVVSVLAVKGNQVRIGIDAPSNVQVHREEIYKKIQEEKGLPLKAKAVLIKKPVIIKAKHGKTLTRKNPSKNEGHIDNVGNC